MFLWKIFKKVRASSREAIDNPKLYKLLKMDDDKVNEILGVFMQIKGEHPKYKSFIKLPIEIVFNLKRIFKPDTERDFEDVVEACHIVSELSYKKLLRKNTHEICKYYKFVINGLDSLMEMQEALSRKIDAVEHKAGINRLNPFGELTSLKLVADYYRISIYEAQKVPYEECFAIWLYQKERAEYEKLYFEIKNKPK